MHDYVYHMCAHAQLNMSQARGVGAPIVGRRRYRGLGPPAACWRGTHYNTLWTTRGLHRRRVQADDWAVDFGASYPAWASRTGCTLQEVTDGQCWWLRAGGQWARVLYPDDIKAIPKGTSNEASLLAVVHVPRALPSRGPHANTVLSPRLVIHA